MSGEKFVAKMALTVAKIFSSTGIECTPVVEKNARNIAVVWNTHWNAEALKCLLCDKLVDSDKHLESNLHTKKLNWGQSDIDHRISLAVKKSSLRDIAGLSWAEPRVLNDHQDWLISSSTHDSNLDESTANANLSNHVRFATRSPSQISVSVAGAEVDAEADDISLADDDFQGPSSLLDKPEFLNAKANFYKVSQALTELRADGKSLPKEVLAELPDFSRWKKLLRDLNIPSLIKAADMESLENNFPDFMRYINNAPRNAVKGRVLSNAALKGLSRHIHVDLTLENYEDAWLYIIQRKFKDLEWALRCILKKCICPIELRKEFTDEEKLEVPDDLNLGAKTQTTNSNYTEALYKNKELGSKFTEERELMDYFQKNLHERSAFEALSKEVLDDSDYKELFMRGYEVPLQRVENFKDNYGCCTICWRHQPGTRRDQHDQFGSETFEAKEISNGNSYMYTWSRKTWRNMIVHIRDPPIFDMSPLQKNFFYKLKEKAEKYISDTVADLDRIDDATRLRIQKGLVRVDDLYFEYMRQKYPEAVDEARKVKCVWKILRVPKSGLKDFDTADSALHQAVKKSDVQGVKKYLSKFRNEAAELCVDLNLLINYRNRYKDTAKDIALYYLPRSEHGSTERQKLKKILGLIEEAEQSCA